jgi:hypothetical protein
MGRNDNLTIGRRVMNCVLQQIHEDLLHQVAFDPKHGNIVVDVNLHVAIA